MSDRNLRELERSGCLGELLLDLFKRETDELVELLEPRSPDDFAPRVKHCETVMAEDRRVQAVVQAGLDFVVMDSHHADGAGSVFMLEPRVARALGIALIKAANLSQARKNGLHECQEPGCVMTGLLEPWPLLIRADPGPSQERPEESPYPEGSYMDTLWRAAFGGEPPPVSSR